MSSTPLKPNTTTPNLKEDRFLDKSLRPSMWSEYVGQENIKQNLQILLGAALERKHPPEHLLFYGPPGLGKTTLAYLIAKELGAQIKVTSGPAIEKVGDLASILTNLSAGDVLFIDEIHRLNKNIEEVLYPAMESGNLNIIIGKGPGARIIQLDLPPFTLVSATTRIALLSSPLRSRFSGGTFRLEFYTEEEISRIISRSAHILGVDISPEASLLISKRSRFTPRIANHFLKRCRDFAQIHNANKITEQIVEESLGLLGIDKLGLTVADREVLHLIATKFTGGPVGLGTIAVALSEEEATVEEVYEPYLIQLGFLDRTARGRVLTEAGYKHIGLEKPSNSLF
jgi:holliday junction DNA helicase RuvB